MSLRTSDVSLCYGDGDQTTYALCALTAEFPERGFFGIMGPSGSGKSSLLYVLSGLKQPSAGDIFYGESSIVARHESARTALRRDQFGFVFQQPYLLNYLTARENVLIAAPRRGADSEAHVDELLCELGIDHLGSRLPTHLSGGERQRIVVARAMVNRPSIIFADEPTAALDHANGHAVIDLLKRYRDRGAVLVVSHDPTMLAEADRIYHMIDGQLESVEERAGL